MVNAKLDLIMKKLDIENKEVMHINDSHMTCEDVETTRTQLSVALHCKRM